MTLVEVRYFTMYTYVVQKYHESIGIYHIPNISLPTQEFMCNVTACFLRYVTEFRFLNKVRYIPRDLFPLKFHFSGMTWMRAVMKLESVTASAGSGWRCASDDDGRRRSLP